MKTWPFLIALLLSTAIHAKNSFTLKIPLDKKHKIYSASDYKFAVDFQLDDHRKYKRIEIEVLNPEIAIIEYGPIRLSRTYLLQIIVGKELYVIGELVHPKTSLKLRELSKNNYNMPTLYVSDHQIPIPNTELRLKLTFFES